MRLLVLRPQPAAAETAAALRARGHEPIVAPLMRIEMLSQADLNAGPWDAFLITSANALPGLANQTPREGVLSVPVFTVGERTAQQLRQRGFHSVTSTGGNVNDLARLVAARLEPSARLLYLAGKDRSGDLAGDLRAKGFAVDIVEVYRAVTARELPQTVIDALADGIDAVLHYSRRSTQTYISAALHSDVLATALSPAHFCLSAQVAEPLAEAGAAIIRVAPQPNEVGLLALIGPITH